ncbi:MAG: murein biosynthesis integral membrane protein MurJ [Treponemataceae bacterium]|nr:murein biosynthesis integral membrane protein MurJ [Treponemataceae bacterium]
MKKTKEKSKSLAKAGLSLSVLTLCSRILGLIREMTKAAFLGTSGLADAFGVAFMIPNLFRRLFAENSVSVAFIPTFKAYLENANNAESDEEKEKIKKETKIFINSTFTLVTFLTAIVVAVGVILSPWIVKLFSNGESPEVTSEMNVMTRIMFPYLIFISIAALFQGILNGVKVFAPSGFTPVLFNSIVIAATYILSPYTKNPARAMSYGVLAGGLIQAAFQLPFVIKNGWGIKFSSLKNAFTNPGTRQVLKLIAPTIIGMAAYQLNDVVSTAIASRTGTGIVSSLQYSLRLQELILGIFAVSIGTVILPDLAGLAKNKKWEDFNSMLIQAMKIIALITIPITFYSLIYGENLIILVYKSKTFTEESVALTLQAFRFHIAGLFFIALNRIISPAFYAQSDAKSPTWAGMIGFAFNIILAFALAKPMQGGGIALALTLASFANTVALFFFMKKSKTIDVNKVIKAILLYALKIAGLSVIASLPVYFLKPLLLKPFASYNRFIAQGLPVLISAIIFAIAGILLLIICRDPLVKIIASKFLRRGKKTENIQGESNENQSK